MPVKTDVRPLDALKAEVRGLLEQITEDEIWFVELHTDTTPTADFSDDAEKLRDAIARLDQIVRGITAVHLL